RIAVVADGRSHSPDGDGSIAIHATGDVAKSAGGRIERRGIVGNAIGYAQVQSVLKDVLALPDAVRQKPLLQAGAGACWCISQISVAFVGYVQGRRVRKPDSKRIVVVGAGTLGEYNRESGKYRDGSARGVCNVGQGARITHLVHRVDSVRPA